MDFKNQELIAELLQSQEQDQNGFDNFKWRLDKKYVLTEEDLQEYPGRIISIFEFEVGISKLYEFLNKYDPLKVIPRSIAGNQLLLQGYSNDPSYGFTKENPIKVGGYHLIDSQQIYDYFYSIEGYDSTPLIINI